MIDDEIIANKGNSKNDTDKTAKILSKIPNWLLKIGIGIIKWMDKHNCLPKKLIELSPFHTSCFLTNMKSISTDYVYHHLYDFGNLPVFGSFGCKRKALEPQEDGTIAERKYVDFKFTLDERIVDGYYYAAFFKSFKRVVARPEVLDYPPEEIKADIP